MCERDNNNFRKMLPKALKGLKITSKSSKCSSDRDATKKDEFDEYEIAANEIDYIWSPENSQKYDSESESDEEESEEQRYMALGSMSISQNNCEMPSEYWQFQKLIKFIRVMTFN